MLQKVLVLNMINVQKDSDRQCFQYLCEAALYDETLLLCFSVCSVRPVLSVLLILSSNQCLIISFTSRAFNARIAYCCIDNRFVCPNVKFLLLLGKSLSGTLFPMNVTFTHKMVSLCQGLLGNTSRNGNFQEICLLFVIYLVNI